MMDCSPLIFLLGFVFGAGAFWAGYIFGYRRATPNGDPRRLRALGLEACDAGLAAIPCKKEDCHKCSCTKGSLESIQEDLKK